MVVSCHLAPPFLEEAQNLRKAPWLVGFLEICTHSTFKCHHPPALGPRAGWCTWPGARASPRLGSGSSGRSSPGPPAAGRWRPCDCAAAFGAGSRSEPQGWCLEMCSRWEARETSGFNWMGQWSRLETGCVKTKCNVGMTGEELLLFLTSQPLCQGEGVHRGPVVRRVLGLLRRLLVEVVHGAEWVHSVEGVAVHPVVLHGRRASASAGRGRNKQCEASGRAAVWSFSMVRTDSEAAKKKSGWFEMCTSSKNK